MESLHSLQQFDTLKTQTMSDGSHALISNGISSLNFDGDIPKKIIVKKAKELIEGDIVYFSDPLYSADQYIITSILSYPVSYTISGKTITGNSGSNTVTISDASEVVENMEVSGTGIQSGTIISFINYDTNQITLSLNITQNLTSSNVSIVGTRDVYKVYYLNEFVNELQYTHLSDYLDISESELHYGGYNEDTSFYTVSDSLEDISIGTKGWKITNNGNAVFSNVFVRGTIEATDGKFDGIVTAGDDNASVSIGKNLFGSNPFYDTPTSQNPSVNAGEEVHGLFIDTNNYLFTFNRDTKYIPSTIQIANGTDSNSYSYYATITYSDNIQTDSGDDAGIHLLRNTNIDILQVSDTNDGVSITDTPRTLSSLNGNFKIVNTPVTSISRSGSTLTISAPSHNLAIGDIVFLEGFTGSYANLNTPIGTLNTSTYWKVLSTSFGTDSFKVTVPTSGTISSFAPIGVSVRKKNTFTIQLGFELTTYVDPSTHKKTITTSGGIVENTGFINNLSITQIDLFRKTQTTAQSNCTLTFTDALPSNTFTVDSYVDLINFENLNLNGTFKITEVTNNSLTVQINRLSAKTYNNIKGYIKSSKQISRFKVGSLNNYLSYNSDIDKLIVTGEINATGGTFSGSVKTGGTQNIKIDGINNGIYFSNASGTSYPAYIKAYNDGIGTKTEGIDINYTSGGNASDIYLTNSLIYASVNVNTFLSLQPSKITLSSSATELQGTTTIAPYDSTQHGLVVSGSSRRVYLPATTNATTTTTAANMYLGGSGTSPEGQIIKSTNSSIRYKNSITKNLELNPNSILDIDVVQFKFNNDYLSEDDPNYDKFVIGLIAEDVFEKYPLAADLNNDGTPENWNPRFLIPAMLKVIQNLENRIALLEDK